MTVQNAPATTPQKPGFAVRAFSAAAQKLASQTQASALCEMEWFENDHQYGSACHFRTLNMLQAEDGTWAVGTTRAKYEAVSELLVSRLAAAAGLPVAPVFVHDAYANETYDLLSVIPFDAIIRGRNLPLLHMPAYQAHYSMMLPFMMWLGPEMDRHEDNMCMDANNHTAFAEYDFEATSLVTALDAHADSTVNTRLWPVVETVFHRANIQQVLHDHFMRGYKRLRAITPEVVHHTLDLIDEAVPLNKRERNAVIRHIGERRALLDAAVASGGLNRLMAPQAVSQGCHEAARSKNRYSELRYSFAG